MTMIMIEGFEQIDPTYDMTSTSFKELLQGVTPDITDGWFTGTDDTVLHNVNGRIEGNCLRFTRGADVSPGWSADIAANLGFSFTPKQKMTAGFAMRWSDIPTIPVPLAAYRYDFGEGAQEQISLWGTPDGSLYISVTPYNATFSALAVGINPETLTPTGTFRWTQYTYFEFVVDYLADPPTCSVLVNGQSVINRADEDVKNLADHDYVSQFHLFNPVNQHFNGATFWQSIDDLYLDDANTHGPQWIVGLDNGAVQFNDGWDGVPQSVYPNFLPVEATDYGDVITWLLSDPPVGVGTVTAIGVNIIASQPALIDAVEFGVANSSNGSPRTKKVTVDESGLDRCFRYCTASLPSGISLTGASIASMRGYLRSSVVIT